MLYNLHALIKLNRADGYAMNMPELQQWTKDLIVEQGMEIVIGPNVHYVADEGNEGPTGGANIKTSHFAYHIWEKQGIIQADLYTCGCLDIVKLFKRFGAFNAQTASFMLIERETNLNVLFALNHLDPSIMLERLHKLQQLNAKTLGLEK